MKKIPVIRHYKDLPFTKILLWFPGGASLEETHELGFAHLIEHLIFKLRYKETGLAEYIETLGGYSNAYTSHDDVVVEISVINDHVKEAVTFLEKIIVKSLESIPVNEFEEERAVVIEEMLMYDDEPIENLFITMMKCAFNGHPYGRKIIGEKSTLLSADLKILDYFFNQKMKHNPFLVVAGGYNDKISFKIDMSSHFKNPQINKWDAKQLFITNHHQNKDYFMAGWPLQAENGELAAMNKLIYTITYGMDGGRLYNDLIYEHSVFDNLSLSVVTGRKGSLFVQTGAFSPTNERKRIEKWMKAWNSFDFTQREVAKAKEVILSTNYFNSESLGEIPDQIGKSYLMYNDPQKFTRDYFYSVFHYTAKELNAFKQHHLSMDKAILGMALPQKSRFSFDKVSLQTKTSKPKAEFFVKNRKKGARAAAYIRESSPFLSLYLIKKSGVNSEIPGKSGGTSLFLDTLCTSAKGMTKEETEEFLDRFGITLSPVVGNNTGGIRIKVRDSLVPEGLEILKKILNNPMKKEYFEQEKQFALANFSLRKEDPAFNIKEAIHKNLFPGTSYQNLIVGTEKELQKVTFPDIKKIRTNFFNQNHWSVGMSGSISEEERLDLLNELSSESIRSKRIKTPEFPSLADRIIEVPAKGKKQLYITRTFYAPGIYDKSFETVRLIEQFLMGQKSPFFQLLRESMGLVYSLDILGTGTVFGGYFALSAITSPEKQGEVMDRIDQTIKILKSGDFSEDFLLEIKNNMKFQHAQSRVRNDYHAFNLALEEALDFPFKNYLQLPDILDKIGKNEIVDVARTYFSDGLWLISRG